MGTIFADETESAPDRRGDGERSVFREREPTDECDDAAHSDGDSSDDVEPDSDGDSSDDVEPDSDGDSSDDDSAASAPTMPVFSNGERIEFEVDDH